MIQLNEFHSTPGYGNLWGVCSEVVDHTPLDVTLVINKEL